MPGITTSAPPARPSALGSEPSAPLRQAFQKFVAGTFYRQMLKSLRKMHGRPAYFHGGQAEEIFRNQMDQQVAENLADSRGSALAAPLYHAFAQQLRLAVHPTPLPNNGERAKR